MINNIPALPSAMKVCRDAARATKRVALLSMKKLSAETLNELLGLPELVVKRLGVDEIALKKGHKQYALVLSDLDRRCVIAVLPERSQEAFKEWLLALGETERSAIDVVAMDMWGPYRGVVEAVLPQAEIVADRFHIMKQLNERINQLRRGLQRQADKPTAQALKGSRWLLLKRRSELSPDEASKLQAALAHSDELRQAYLLKEEFRILAVRMQGRKAHRPGAGRTLFSSLGVPC